MLMSSGHDEIRAQPADGARHAAKAELRLIV
jgi:hypothetical protein